MRQTLSFLGAVPNRGVEFVRVHYLLNLVTGAKSRAGIAYDWSLLDEALDVLIHRGLRPVFELMGNPSDLFDDFENPDQLRAWRDLVAELAARCVRRYGRDEVRAWTFETWNEPDLPFWRWGERGFLNHFDACRAGLDAVDPASGSAAPRRRGRCPPCSRRFSPIATGARARSPASLRRGSTSSPSTRRALRPTTRTSPRGRSP